MFVALLAALCLATPEPPAPAPGTTPAAAEAPAAEAAKAQPVPEPAPAAAPAVTAAEPAATGAAEPVAQDDEDAAADAADEHDAERESAEAGEAPRDPRHRYTGELDDAELERRWKEAPDSVGSLSVGFTDAGRLINGVRFPEGPHWKLLDPERQYGTEELVGYVASAIEAVADAIPETPPLRVGHVSRKDGGWLRPHQSHQAGRDIDLCFYERAVPDKKGDHFDVPRNWALVKALLVHGDVQFILVDKRIQKRLYDHALAAGEDKAWLDSLFHAGRESIVFHARRHRDHFHVRYYAPRSQELGRRVQPLLPKGKAEYNVAVHRVRSGDNLGKIARKYDTTITAIRKANGLKGNLIRAGQTLHVPLGTACIDCPVPPEVVVPPRRLSPLPPPPPESASVAAPAAVTAAP